MLPINVLYCIWFVYLFSQSPFSQEIHYIGLGCHELDTERQCISSEIKCFEQQLLPKKQTLLSSKTTFWQKTCFILGLSTKNQISFGNLCDGQDLILGPIIAHPRIQLISVFIDGHNKLSSDEELRYHILSQSDHFSRPFIHFYDFR